MNEYTFNTEFQQHALAVLLRVPAALIRYRTALDHTYFSTDSTRVIAEVLFAFVDEQRSLPSKSTFLELLAAQEGDDAKRAARVAQRMFKEDISDAKAVLEMLVEFGRQQALVNAVTVAAEKIDRGDKASIRALFDEAALVGADVLDVGIDYKGTTPARAKAYRYPEDEQVLIRTGLPHMDSVLGGGLARGELGVILAPPKRGKTTTLINLGFGAATAVQGYTVVHYTMEMSDHKVSRRYDDRLMGKRVAYKTSDPRRYGQELRERVGTLMRGRLFVKGHRTRTATVSNLRSNLTLLTAQGVRPDVVIVDYADIMRPERRLGELRHEQAGVYEDLRQLAQEFGVVLWTASQTSRAALSKETITIEDFAESFEKAAVVDAAFAFCQTADERIAQRCRLFAAALRNAEDGKTIECVIDRATARLRSVALYDVAGARVLLDGEDADPAADSKSVVRKGVRAEQAEKLKEAGGIKKTVRRKRSAKPSKKITY